MRKAMILYTSTLTIAISIIFSINAFSTNIRVGAECTEDYISILEGKSVAIVANQTSMVKNQHIVDTLLSLEIDIKKIFSPEHGFRGKADAGEHVNSNIDKKTKLAIKSLYGKHKKPNADDLKGIDILVFDIQDVGARFYTYISTLHYVMEACAENNVPVIVLDRPNPNGYFVDGPVLDTAYRSFVGMHPVPIAHGMTIGEYAGMINGEKWLKNEIKCNLKVIVCDNYSHSTHYSLPVKPSPNLPNDLSISLYPTLCLFEGTVISCGRGTDFPFQTIGNPKLKKDFSFSFTPRSIEGASKNPRYKGETCYGLDFRSDTCEFQYKRGVINVDLLILMYNSYMNKGEFFNSFFTKLAGSSILQNQIESGLSANEIRQSWQNDLDNFKTIRNKYLLYK